MYTCTYVYIHTYVKYIRTYVVLTKEQSKTARIQDKTIFKMKDNKYKELLLPEESTIFCFESTDEVFHYGKK